MELSQARSELDGSLPEPLRITAELLENTRSEASETSGDPLTQSEDTQMTTPNPNLTSADQVKAAAAAEVQRIFAEQNNQGLVASTLERHMAAANTAQATATAAEARATAAETKLAAVEAELAEAKKKLPTGEPTNKEAADKDAKENKGKAEASATVVAPVADANTQAIAALSQQVADLTAALAAEKADKKKVDLKAKFADRKAKAEKAGVKSKKWMDKATASTEAGEPVMPDTEFDSALEALSEEAPAAETQAVAGDGGGAPIPAPKDDAGPSSKQKAPSLTGSGKNGATPVAAPKDGTGPAAGQRTAKMAHASDDAAGAATEQAVASTPAAPDLSAAQIMEQATAALMQGGPAVSATGKSSYAAAFKI